MEEEKTFEEVRQKKQDYLKDLYSNPPKFCAPPLGQYDESLNSVKK
jgi:hypothetical protein